MERPEARTYQLSDQQIETFNTGGMAGVRSVVDENCHSSRKRRALPWTIFSRLLVRGGKMPWQPALVGPPRRFFVRSIQRFWRWREERDSPRFRALAQGHITALQERH
jgi:hypothetical protein